MYYNILIGHSNTLLLHLKLGLFFKYYVNYDEMLLTPLRRTLVWDSSLLLGCYVAVCLGPAYCCSAPSTSPPPRDGGHTRHYSDRDHGDEYIRPGHR